MIIKVRMTLDLHNAVSNSITLQAFSDINLITTGTPLLNNVSFHCLISYLMILSQ